MEPDHDQQDPRDGVGGGGGGDEPSTPRRRRSSRAAGLARAAREGPDALPSYPRERGRELAEGPDRSPTAARRLPCRHHHQESWSRRKETIQTRELFSV
jgi:hypothetical protein